jgi:predicted ATPase/transcriptional regulator with XRE-family HTH domain
MAPSDLIFGELLRQLRKAAGLTQAELAERAGLSVRGINDLERGARRTPRRDTLALLSEALGLVGEERMAFVASARRRPSPSAGGATHVNVSVNVARQAVRADDSPRQAAATNRHNLHNLPVQPTPILGREREIDEVGRLLRRDDVRLVTLTGPGGIGKTRLSLEVATQALEEFRDGVWFVRLSRLTDADLVVPAIARTLNLRDGGGMPVADALQAYLHAKQSLLVLDNFEHLASAASSVGELLRMCPDAKALVTSRAALRLQGEHEYAVRPLDLPDPQRPALSGRLSQYAAVMLFIARAQAARADFQVTSAITSAVAEICARLDGLPLAIELAAARVKLLPPPVLLKRLERQLPLLVGGARDLDERQQTMRNTLSWSYNLLAPAERRLFRRLAVFVSGCTLEMAEAICEAPEGATPPGLDLLNGLGRLVDQSLVQQREEDGESRLGMLHVVREFALEQLETSEEVEVMRRAHAEQMLTLSAVAPVGMRAGSDARWLAKLEREHDNIRAALGWALERNEAELSLRLGVGFAPFWWARGYYGEGRRWMARVVDATQSSLEFVGPDTSVVVLHAWALWWLGKLAWNQSDITSAREWADKCLDAARASGDPAIIAVALSSAGSVQLEPPVRDLQHGEALLAEALALARHSNDVEVLVRVQGDKFNAFVDTVRELAEAQALAKELLEAARRLDTLTCLNVEAHVSLAFANVAQRLGDVSSAALHAEFTLRTVREHGFTVWTADCFRVLAWVADQTDNGMRSACLLGASATEAERQGIIGHLERLEQQMSQAATRKTLGESAWAAAYAAGRALSLEEAIDEALSDGDG